MKYPEEFEDKEDLRDYVVELIINTGVSPSLKNTHPNVYKFFVCLFQRHPEKDRKEVSLIIDISIRKFPISALKKNGPEYSDYQFFIIKSNGSNDSISWNSCINKEVSTVDRCMYWSMRYAIRDQVIEFKNLNKNKPCKFCGTYSYLTVDHVIKFKKLTEDFILENPEHPTEFSKNKFASTMFREEDIKFANLWQDYHKKNATLRILCRDCNRKIDKYPLSIIEHRIRARQSSFLEK